ncbi:MAG: DUF2007 domain-containing protein [Alphaproteobacteria bacterium]
MKELVRSNDLVMLSWLRARLAEEGIELFLLDQHASAVDGSIGILPRRAMVADEHHARAKAILERGPDGPASVDTEDALLDGRVIVRQPADGYRISMDAVFLAACVAPKPGEIVLDAGSGVGAAALCLAARCAGVEIVGLELHDSLADFATENAGANNFADRVRFVTGDILRPPPAVAQRQFDHVMMNPPFHDADATRASANALRAAAHTEGEAKLADWIGVALRRVKDRGTITLVHRADRLAEILSLLEGAAGDATVFPLWPKVDTQAKRVLVQATKASKGKLHLLPGLVVHNQDGSLTPLAEDVIRHAKGIDLG